MRPRIGGATIEEASLRRKRGFAPTIHDLSERCSRSPEYAPLDALRDAIGGSDHRLIEIGMFARRRISFTSSSKSLNASSLAAA